MAVLPIRLLGDPILATRAQDVTRFDSALAQLVADMTETMLAAPGIGLAAPQVGVGLQVLVYSVSEEEAGHLCNPRLELSEESEPAEEGCLSMPGLMVTVTRAQSVVASGHDLTGRPVTIPAAGLLARCLQHEADHLAGILTIDRTSREERKRAMREIRDSAWFTTGVAPSLTGVRPGLG